MAEWDHQTYGIHHGQLHHSTPQHRGGASAHNMSERVASPSFSVRSEYDYASQRIIASRPGYTSDATPQLPPIAPSQHRSAFRGPSVDSVPMKIASAPSEPRRAWGNETYLPRKIDTRQTQEADVVSHHDLQPRPPASPRPPSAVRLNGAYNHFKVPPRSPTVERRVPPAAFSQVRNISSSAASHLHVPNEGVLYGKTDEQAEHAAHDQGSREWAVPESNQVVNNTSRGLPYGKPILDEIAHLHQIIDKQNDNVESLRQQAENANQKLALEVARKESADSAKRIVEAAEKLAASERRAQELEQQLVDTIAIKKKQENEIAKMTENLTILNSDIDAQRQAAQIAKARVLELEASAADDDLNIKSIQADLESTQDILASVQAEKDAAITSVESLHSKVELLTATASAATAASETSAAALKATQKKFSDMEAEMNSKITSLESYASSYKVQLEAAQTKVSELSTELLSAHEARDSKSKELATSERVHSEKVKVAENKTADVLAQLARAVQTHTEFETRCAKLESEVKAAKQEQAVAMAAQRDTDLKSKAVEDALEGHVQQLKEMLEIKAKESEAEASLFQGKIQDLEEELLGREARILDKDGEIAKLICAANSNKPDVLVPNDNQLSKLALENQKLQEELQESQNVISAQQAEIAKLHSPGDTMTNGVTKRAEKDISGEAFQQLSILKLKLEDADREKQISTERINQLQLQLQSLETKYSVEVSARKAEVDALQEKSAALIERTQSEHMSNEGQENVLQEEVNQLRAHISEVENDRGRLQAELSNAQVAAREEATDIEFQLVEVTAEAETLKQQLQAKSDECVQLTQEVSAARAKLDSLDVGSSKLNEQIIQLKKEKIALEKKISDGFLSPKEQSDLKDEHAQKLHELGTQAQLAKEAAEKAKSEAEKARNEQQRQHGEDQIAISALSSMRDTLKAKVTILETRVAELTAQSATTAALFSQIGELEEKVAELQDTLAERDAEVAEIRAEMEDVKQKAKEEIENATVNMEKKMEKLEVECKALRTQVARDAAKIEKLEKDKAKAIEELEKKETECKALRAGIEKADEMHQRQIDILKTGIDQYEATLAKIGTLLGINLVVEDSEIDQYEFDPDAGEEVVRGRWQSQIAAPLSKIDEQVGKINTKMVQLKATITEVKEQEAQERELLKRKYESYIQKLKQKIDRKEVVLTDLKTELKEVREKLDAKDTKKENAEAERQRLLSDSARLRDIVENQRGELNSLRGKLADETQLKEALTKRVELRTKNLAAPKLVRSECYAELETVKGKLSKLELTTKTKMAAKNALLSELRNSLAEKDDELERTKALLELAQDSAETPAP